MDATSHGYSAADALRRGGPEEVRTALLAARERTLALADAYAQALGHRMDVPYRTTLNPPVWEQGHVAWFQEYWVARNPERSRGDAADPACARPVSLLERADALYDSSHVEHRSRWGLALPDAAATREYLAATLEGTLELLDELPPTASAQELYFFRLVALHEEMHAEAATYMARSLGITLPARRTARPSSDRQIQIPAQDFQLGYAGPGFAFDNELLAHPVRIEAFTIDAEAVTWKRFMPFVEAGGYRERQWWSDDGWLPLREVPNPKGSLDQAAVHLTAHEAEAWCRWAGRRLPAEAEWECAAMTAPGFHWGEVWEWTASAFEPYPGFMPHPYRDYSQPWFGTRRVLRGACHATSPSLAHPRYRNFFEPHRSDIFAGFRSCAA